MTLTGTSSTSPGAGRFRDIVWPDPIQLDGGPPLASYHSKGIALGAGVQTGLGGGSGNPGPSAWKGIECALFTSTGTGAGIAFRYDGAMNMHLKTARNAIPAVCDDENVFRVYANLACGAGPNAGRDMSFQMMTADSGNQVFLGSTGFGFRFVDANTVNFMTNGTANGLKETPVMVGGDITAWHSYEMRFFSATANADAKLQVLIDNVLIAVPDQFSNWGNANTFLPGSALRLGRTGFRACLVMNDNKVNQLYCSAIRFMSAQFPSALF